MAQRRPRGFFWWFLRILGGLAVLLILLGIIGAIYQSRATAADRARYSPPGELVIVNERQMHIHCQGEGSPTVILDAGQGGWSITWSELMPQLSESTRVCAYDRAGYGWSDAAADERSPQALAHDLAALLDTAGTEAPYVLVAFSAAALPARLLAAQHPNEVAGMVLIDPATEFDNELLGEELLRQQRSAVGMFQSFGTAARLGIVRFLDPREMAPYAPFISQDPAEPEIYYSFVSEPRWWRTSQKEFAARLDDEALADVRVNGALPDIPVLIIGAEHGAGNPELDQARVQVLEELASRSSQGRFVLAEGSSHEVLRDRPGLVTEAIVEVVEAVRER